MLQKKEYQQRYQTPTKIPVTPTKPNVTKEGIQQHRQNNVTKQGITTTPTTIKNVTKQETPTKPNVTKEGISTTTTIKKPIVENQTSGKIKTNVTKEGIPTTPTPTEIPTTQQQ